MNIEKVYFKKQLLAIFFKKNLKSKGVTFLTGEQHPLQLGLIEHPSGFIVKEHIHNYNIKYKVDITEEFLYVERGIVVLKLFNNNWKLVHERRLSKGDFVLLVSGGHGLEVLKNCRIIEVKQGPYPGDKLAKLHKD